MKAELLAREHFTEPDETICEVWYAGELIGVVYAANGPGIKFVSKYIDAADSVKMKVLPDRRVGAVHITLNR